VGVGRGAGRRVVGRRAGAGCVVVELLVFCASAETANDKTSVAVMNIFLNIMAPL
jgi:hypothetical protein